MMYCYSSHKDYVNTRASFLPIFACVLCAKFGQSGMEVRVKLTRSSFEAHLKFVCSPSTYLTIGSVAPSQLAKRTDNAIYGLANLPTLASLLSVDALLFLTP